MKRKLKRSRQSVFGRRGMPPALKTVLGIVVCIAVVAAGYFGAMLVSKGSLSQPDTSVDTSVDAPETPGSDGDTTRPDTPKPPANTPAITDTIRAFYLPPSALSSGDLASTFTAANQAGFNAVIFDLKDAEGNLYYHFTNAQAVKVNTFTADALTSDGLTALFSLMRDNGLQPIPRLYAFCDNLGAKALADARIMLASNHSWGWYDADPNNGGRRWLNPYSDAAQSYIQSLASELKDKGAAAVMLDGVQFPHQLKDAYLGEDAATVTKDAVLTAFINETRTLLGEDCLLLLACTGDSALGTNTQVYGGNPLTFGATVVSPLLTAKIEESVEKMILRTQVLDSKPVLAPMLSADSLTAKQVADAITAYVAGGADSFILYHSEGQYDFSAYHLP